MLRDLYKKALEGGLIDRDEVMSLWESNLDELCRLADDLRAKICGDSFDLCTIVNGKSGRCSENCKFCSQSSFYSTESDCYPLMDSDSLARDAARCEALGMLRYSVVTSGKRLSDDEVDALCESYRRISKSSSMSLCASHGLLSFEQLKKIKAAGVVRYHNNLETSRSFFPSVCTTHSFDEKIETVKAAQRAGLEVCCGGIIGLGESRGDKVDMVMETRSLGVRSIPMNVLNPIPGTPFADIPPLSYDEVRRTAAIFRFIIPNGAIRLAGGRGLMRDKGRALMQSGVNAAISGDMLTTAGISAASDLSMISELGFKARLI